MKNIIKTALLLRVPGGLAACKLAVIFPSGRFITSASRKRDYRRGSLCEHNITDSAFTESFTAVASPGDVFSKCSSGAEFFGVTLLGDTM